MCIHIDDGSWLWWGREVLLEKDYIKADIIKLTASVYETVSLDDYTTNYRLVKNKVWQEIDVQIELLGQQ